MNQPYPYPAPPSFYPIPPPPHSSSIALDQQAVPAHTKSQQQQQQLQEYISPHSHPGAHQYSIHNGNPSEEERAAALILQAIPDPIFFGYLESFRSSIRGETIFYPKHLSDQQFQAFLDLHGCSNELILKLRSIAGSLTSSKNLYHSSTPGDGRVAANILNQSPSLVSTASTRNTLKSPSLQGSYIPPRDGSVRLSKSPAASSNKHKRWCFFCEHHKPCRTADGLKRHLREHFTKYFCIPQEPLVYKEDGPRCAFCDIPNPDAIHLNTHVTSCIGKKYPRKSHLIDHLETKHGVHDGSVLIDYSEFSVDLKYFACGFCVFCCGSLIELANHVDAHHYKVLQHISHWDDEKVIRGLQSHPAVVECWQAILASNPPLDEPWLRRMPMLVEQLERRLEMSRGPAETFYHAAIDASNYRRNWYRYSEPVSADQRLVANQMIEPFRQDAISPLSFNSEQSQIAYAPHTPATFPQSQHLAIGYDRLNLTDWDEGRPNLQIASNTYESPTGATYQHPSHRSHISYPSDYESIMQYRYPAYSSSKVSASGSSRVFEGQASAPYTLRLGGHPPGLSFNIATNPGSRHELETYTSPAQGHASWNYPASTIESVSSSLSRDHNIQSQSHFNDTCSPRGYSPLASQSTRGDLAHRRGIDLDSDSDDQQCLTQARGPSRRRRRAR